MNSFILESEKKYNLIEDEKLKLIKENSETKTSFENRYGQL